ncbi:four helix bundle protein [Rubritalea tangerina]|uniref:Four helix bundle protein n=1 Tax=Rubritalea tangerina TaxID=430798 RepID=A0ABW4ZBH8_9BACT
MSVRNFEDLDVWKRSCQLAVDVYTTLHSSKDYGLKDQMQRAAVSIASNIAEGSERASTQEYIRFLRIAKASSAELRTQLYIAEKVSQTTPTQLPPLTILIKESKEISAMLQGLINSLSRHPH